jgi:hypothetical protein
MHTNNSSVSFMYELGEYILSAGKGGCYRLALSARLFIRLSNEIDQSRLKFYLYQ